MDAQIVWAYNMSAWDPPRHISLEYPYDIPDFISIDGWLQRRPTHVRVSPDTMCAGCVIESSNEIWLCVNTVPDSGGLSVDIHWVCWDRPKGDMKHIQQVFRKNSIPLWDIAVYTLRLKKQVDYCPTCNVQLEWAALAEKCPKCWWVKGV